MSRIAVFPGSFSPFTLGHKSVVDRSLPLFDKIIIAIGINSEKNEYFSIEEREKWIKDIYKDNPKIEVQFYEGLTVDFCEKAEAKYITLRVEELKDEIELNNIIEDEKLKEIQQITKDENKKKVDKKNSPFPPLNI